MQFSSNQVAVVTGASSGVGKAIALAVAAEGASLALVGRDLSALEAVARQVPAGAGEVRCYVADLTQDAALRHFTGKVLADFGRVDFLVHCAAILARGRMAVATAEDFDLQFACNVRAPFVINQQFLPSLLKHQGAVIFINSSAGLGAKPDMGQYSATKHALKAIADCLRQEVAASGLRVLSIFLGRTATPMQEALCHSEGKTYDPTLYIQPSDVAQSVLATLKLPCSAEITDLTLRPTR
jgi:NADP-dependent 3-hydroxy acid dehydrogenase YdfG